ncbi:RNA helicase [Cytobacillus suaedae]|nr:RNA helicase [Cytobacillus suaedae]
MEQINAIHQNAIEHTKRKVLEDLDRFFESRAEMPSFEEYIEERKHYIDQIWLNVWLNKSTNAVSKHLKKAHLEEVGYDVEGLDRRLVIKLFRTEMRKYSPFDVNEWFTKTYKSNETLWEESYSKARIQFIKRQKKAEEQEKQEALKERVARASLKLIRQKHEEVYLYLRYFVASKLKSDIESKPVYETIDPVKIEETLTEVDVFEIGYNTKVSDFFETLTGSVHKVSLEWERRHYEYETYFYVYQRLMTKYLSEFIPGWLLSQLSPSILSQYQERFNEALTEKVINYLILEQIYDYIESFFYRINDEYLADLLTVAELPFDLEMHREKFEQDLAERERKIAEEKAELERKKQEEKRMLEDIFGREYSPPAGRNIRYVLHVGETNTGKTFQALKRMKEADSGLYLAPLRLLALEVYDKLNADGVPCSLKTGEEEKLTRGANHISSTVEMFHEKESYDIVVIDEAQMISDKDRGFSWYKAITKANANEVHIIGSRNMKQMILQLLGDSDIEINEYEREIPLEVEQKTFNIKDTKKGDALVCFSRKRVLEIASVLQNNKRSVSMIYGSMPPETRKKQMQRFINGETNVIVSTDAIGMGLNLPIRRIVFLENEKFDGTRRRRLTSQEVKQIAGRAGRKGIYDVGKVAFTSDIKAMTKLLEKEDISISSFAIAPTSSVFERFQRYSRKLGVFFELWEKFESPKGTKKASLAEERELYQMVRDTDIEARLSVQELYGFLHLPFSPHDPGLADQWKDTMYAIINREELPEPRIKTGSLEELELSYKAVGLHLLFLYRLERRTEALYWERVREEISDGVHDSLITEVKKIKKKCKKCNKQLPWDFSFQICNECHADRSQSRYKNYYHR